MQAARTNPLYRVYHDLNPTGDPLSANAPLRCSSEDGDFRVKLTSGSFPSRISREAHTAYAYRKALKEVRAAADSLFGSTFLRDRRVTAILDRYFPPKAEASKTTITPAHFLRVAQEFDALLPQTHDRVPVSMRARTMAEADAQRNFLAGRAEAKEVESEDARRPTLLHPLRESDPPQGTPVPGNPTDRKAAARTPQKMREADVAQAPGRSIHAVWLQQVEAAVSGNEPGLLSGAGSAALRSKFQQLVDLAIGFLIPTPSDPPVPRVVISAALYLIDHPSQLPEDAFLRCLRSENVSD